MCGFVGFCSKNIKDKNVIKEMNNQIVHRGPDSDGYYFDKDVNFGFRRLSIIDLKEGSQPILNEAEDIAIIFNGEIYNYQEIREELVAKGYKFKTHTDTEVILHGYEEYGAPLLEPLDIYLATSGQELAGEQTYAFEDRGGRMVAIRPEMTPSISRMVAAKRQELAMPARLYSIANFMRYERPQRGRERVGGCGGHPVGHLLRRPGLSRLLLPALALCAVAVAHADPPSGTGCPAASRPENPAR